MKRQIWELPDCILEQGASGFFKGQVSLSRTLEEEPFEISEVNSSSDEHVDQGFSCREGE